MFRSIITVLALTLTAPLAAGCAVDATEPAADSDESDVTARGDAAIKKEIADAIVGLETGGGEGDADPYKITDVKLARGEAITNALLLSKLLPKLDGVARDDDPIPGLDETPIAKAWADLTSDEDPAVAAKWRHVKSIVERRLTSVKYFDMGYRGSANGSLETGAVAHVIVGQTASGRLIAIWGIDIWT